MTLEELTKRLESLSVHRHAPDSEADHREADKAIIEYIGDECVAKAFDDVGKWYA